MLDAIDNLWPSCTLEIYAGAEGQSGFNTALTQRDWDIVVLECWYAETNGIDWFQVGDMYLNGDARFFVYNWFWYGSSAGQFELFNEMGIADLVVSSYNRLMLVWEPTHPIVRDITDWSQFFLSFLIVRQINLVVDNAFPVTGWDYDFDGICVANGGFSVVRGYAPAYAVQGVAIWENILCFLWDPNSLDTGTWAQIKRSFQY